MNYPNPFFNPYGFQPQQAPMQPAPQQVVRVNGEGGARAYQIGANSSALLLDENGTQVWLVTSDGAGYRTVAAYDIAPHQAEAGPDLSGLEKRIRRLEEKINGNTGNNSAARKKQPDDGTD